ncbi:MAG: hypothetical protein ACO3UU_14790 [Minisyncoccia bacterium]
MNIDLNKNEVRKILDAIEAYKENYSLTKSAEKMLNEAEKKLKGVVES